MAIRVELLLLQAECSQQAVERAQWVKEIVIVPVVMIAVVIERQVAQQGAQAPKRLFQAGHRVDLVPVRDREKDHMRRNLWRAARNHLAPDHLEDALRAVIVAKAIIPHHHNHRVHGMQFFTQNGIVMELPG